jgi:hypothetical protein
MFSYRISCNFRYSSNNSTTAVVRGDTPEVHTLSPLKILWDFGVVCLNSPKIMKKFLLFMEIEKLMMWKLFLALFLTIVSTNVMAEWTYISTTPEGDISYYYDFSTIQRTGNKVKVWSLLDNKKPSKTGIMSFKAQEEYDCSAETVAGLYLITSSDHMSSGSILNSLQVPYEPRPIAPDTVFKRILDMVCH